jgi:hypothetical protein
MTFKTWTILLALLLSFSTRGQEVDQTEESSDSVASKNKEALQSEPKTDAGLSGDQPTLVTSIASIYEMEPAVVRSGLLR